MALFQESQKMFVCFYEKFSLKFIDIHHTTEQLIGIMFGN